jgi:hypothetical protein
MRRSGSTLQFQLAARLAEDAGVGRRIEWVRPEDFPIVRDKYKGYSGLKVFKSHIHTPEMAVEFQQRNAMGVYIYRDIRDAFVSQKDKNRASFTAMWMQNFLESALKNYELWTSLPRVLVSKYEEVMGDLGREVGRVAAHLGIPCDEARSRKIAEEYTLERQKERIANSPRGQLQQHDKTVFDSKELLHRNHISSGESERWRGELAPWQIALVEKRAGRWLVEHGYRLSAARLGPVDQSRVWLMHTAARFLRPIYYRNRTR